MEISVLFSEEEVKWGVTEAVDAAIRHSQDAVEETALPLVFLAKHELPNEGNFKQLVLLILM